MKRLLSILFAVLIATQCFAPVVVNPFIAFPASSTPTPLALSVSALQYFRNFATGALSSVTDESGNGNNLSQATSANQPTGVANAYNGKSCLRFYGVNDFMTHPSVAGAACWMVVKGTTWSTVVSYVGGGSGKGWFADINVAPFDSGPGGFDGTNVRSANTSNRIATGGLHSILITSTKVYVDGSEVSGYKDTGTLGTVTTTQIGTRSDFVNYFAFDLVEYAVLNGTPSAGDRTALHSWAVSEYGAP